MAVFGYTHLFALHGADDPLGHFLVVFEEVVEVGCDVCRQAANGADGIAVVAVVEEYAGVLLEGLQLVL